MKLCEECDKAADILTSFVEKAKLPVEVVANAKGLAVFSAFRAGMYFAGTAGKGIVVARLSDGTWSPPSAFSVKSGGVGLVYGVDVFDCVCVLNTQAAVDAYSLPALTLGGRMDVAAGPVGGKVNMGEAKPVWTYTRSRGLYGGLTVDGTAIKEQKEMNAEFFGEVITASQILQGAVQPQKDSTQWPVGANKLMAVLESLTAPGSAGKFACDE